MRVLSIGNSFSTDAQRWLAQSAASVGEYIFAANLFIGGCPLKKHWDMYLSGKPAYRYEINGESIRWISIHEALYKQGKWDVITLQQVSGDSGRFETFEPYLSRLFKLIKDAQPQAKVYIHKTWAYETDCTLAGFTNYNNSQTEMYSALCNAYQQASEKLGVGIIPSGDAIQYLRNNVSAFDYANGGQSLNRDGFHLSWLYGRYAVALIWVNTLTGKDVRTVNFVPEEFGVRADPELLDVIKQSIHTFLSHMGGKS